MSAIIKKRFYTHKLKFMNFSLLEYEIRAMHLCLFLFEGNKTARQPVKYVISRIPRGSIKLNQKNSGNLWPLSFEFQLAIKLPLKLMVPLTSLQQSDLLSHSLHCIHPKYKRSKRENIIKSFDNK